ncbi:hypothetical protein [Kalamiella sp. sgz302252]|uniref:hypothetical protein n=1 Tax=Pantoea sp. sgz302252 TaxID=3341827 RepID=UPI0036D26C65
MSDIKLTSGYGYIDDKNGVVQSGMRQPLTDFFNFFLSTCRTYSIYDIDLADFYFEYPRDSGQPMRWDYVDRSHMEYIFNEILYENKEVVDVQWIFNHPRSSPNPINYHIIIKFADGTIYEDWMYNIIALAPSGQFRVNISFAPYIGRNSHLHRRAALSQTAKD